MKIKLKVKESTCPVCGSEDLEYFGQIEEQDYSYEITCNECGAEYKEFYKLVFDGILIDDKLLKPNEEVEIEL